MVEDGKDIDCLLERRTPFWPDDCIDLADADGRSKDDRNGEGNGEELLLAGVKSGGGMAWRRGGERGSRVVQWGEGASQGGSGGACAMMLLTPNWQRPSGTDNNGGWVDN